jgi:hypothetical protein
VGGFGPGLLLNTSSPTLHRYFSLDGGGELMMNALRSARQLDLTCLTWSNTPSTGFPTVAVAATAEIMTDTAWYPSLWCTLNYQRVELSAKNYSGCGIRMQV